MGTFTINSFFYYTGTTPGAPLDGEIASKGPFSVGNSASTFEEVSPTIDGVARPGETLNPDYSAFDAQYYGLYDFGGRTFLVMEDDEFGFFLASPEVGLSSSDFPASFSYSEVDDSVTATTPACFLTGTRIATQDGPVAVEELAIGDRLLKQDGTTVPVKWIGRQTVSTRFGPAERLMPVRVLAGALGDGLPVRDLVLTADHALLIDGLLINSGAMVNGTSIINVPFSEMGTSYTVYHVETEDHDIILAEGAPAETFIDYVGRQAFDNYAEYVALYGNDRTIPELPQIRISASRLVPPAIRARLDRCNAA